MCVSNVTLRGWGVRPEQRFRPFSLLLLNHKGSKETGTMKFNKWTTLLLAVSLFCLPVAFTGCAAWSDIKPVPIAEGADAIVVNAERAQNATLGVYKLVTDWEFDNRAALPAEVSRAVDAYRKEFPKAWRESRLILKSYKANKGIGTDDVTRVTALLKATEESLLRLRKEGSTNEVVQAMNSLNTLVNSIRALTAKTTN